jgi:hypothetical protein
MASNRILIAITALVISILSIILISCGGGGGSKTLQSSAPATQGPQPQSTQVTLESPQVGNSTTPLPVKASAASPNGVSGWVVYVDDQPAFQGNPNSDSLSVAVPIANGSHTMYVRAWDQGTAEFGTSPTLRVNVNGSEASVSEATNQPSAPPPSTAQTAPPSSSGPLPSVPGNAKVWTSIQNMDGWQSCSNCAGGHTTDTFWTAAHQGSPSQSGSSREFFIGGGAWSNALFYEKVAQDQSWAAHFLWDFWARFDGSSAAHAHSTEYDIWQVINGREFMIGSQCNFETGVWDVWDNQGFAWKSTGAKCRRFSPDTWHHIQWYVERRGGQYHYGVLVVDGNVYTFDRTFSTRAVGRDNSVGVQFQLDQDGSGAPLHEWVDNVKLSIW